MPRETYNERLKAVSKADFEFVKQTPLFDAIPPEARLKLFRSIKRKAVKAGERFIHQGEEGDSFYVIRSGTCAVNLEKDGAVHPVAILGPGHAVGEMAILTGESRNAHVDARTDMDLWCLGRDEFEDICSEHQEIRHFLTGILTNRLDRSRLTADRPIGKYMITEVLGRGGGSIVYKGVHATLDMPVAIKMLKHKLAMDARFLEQFQGEARTIANLNHENIVKVYDVEQLYRTVFIVMEYLEGRTVERIISQTGRLPLSKALDILIQVAAGLGYAHESGIVHRDVKPANIFIQSNDKAKILDFGLAGSPGVSDSRIIEATPYYVPPERIKCAAVDARSDIYSLGITAFRMVTGEYPFPDDDVAKLLQMHLKDPLPDPRYLANDLPDDFCAFIAKATRKNPADRFQSAAEIIEHLRPTARKLGVSVGGDSARSLTSTNLMLRYRDEHTAIVRRLVKDFSKELEKIGAVLLEAEFKDIECD